MSRRREPADARAAAAVLLATKNTKRTKGPPRERGLRGLDWRPTAAVSCLSCFSWLVLAGCAPKQNTHGLEPLAPDCARPFAEQAQRITAQPGLKPAPKDPNEPYRYYSTEDGATSYLITETGAPGHPAILMQRAAHHDVKTTGCAYGDKAGYQQLVGYLDGLKTWTRKQGATP